MATWTIEQPDEASLTVAFDGLDITITRGQDGVRVVFVDGPASMTERTEDPRGPLLRIRLNDVPIWANPAGPGTPERGEEVDGDGLPLPAAHARIAQLEALLTARSVNTTARRASSPCHANAEGSARR